MRRTAKRITNDGAAMHTHTGQNATTDKAHFFYENVAKLLSKKLCQGMLNSAKLQNVNHNTDQIFFTKSFLTIST